jgi:hypothetical protein
VLTQVRATAYLCDTHSDEGDKEEQQLGMTLDILKQLPELAGENKVCETQDGGHRE